MHGCGTIVGQLLLVVRRVKAAIERAPLDLAAHALLQLGHRRHQQVLIQHAVGHHRVMADEASGILDHQHLVAVLDRVGLLATLDQFRVRLEDAEDLLLVGHRLAEQHTPSGRAAHLLRQLQIMPQFLASAQRALRRANRCPVRRSLEAAASTAVARARCSRSSAKANNRFVALA